MTARHLRLVVEEVPGAWQLSSALTLEGERLDTDAFLGVGVFKSSGARFQVRAPGVAPAFFPLWRGNALVDARVARVLRELAPADVQLVPAEIEGQAGTWFLLNVLRTVSCLDLEHCEEVQSRPDWFGSRDGNPTGEEHWLLLGARLDAARAGDARVFRLEGKRQWIIVRGEVQEALAREGFTGVRFEDVSDVRTLDARTREQAARSREAWRRSDAEREAFLRGLGTNLEPVPGMGEADPQWPRGRHRILRLQRPGGRTLFVTDGLSSPQPGTESGGLGMELALETDEPPLEDEYEATWPARALEGAAEVLLEDAQRRETLEKRPVSVTLGPGSFPESLRDIYMGQGLVVGVKAEDLPERMPLPSGEVRLVMVQALLGPEHDWLQAEKRGPYLLEHLRQAGHGHLSRTRRAPVLSPPPDVLQEIPPEPPPPPKPCFYTLTEDLRAGHYRLPALPSIAAGTALDLKPFLEEAPVTLAEMPRLAWRRPGAARDYLLVDEAVPLVSARVAAVLREHAPEDVALFPVTVEGETEPVFLVHVKRVVHCINDELSTRVLRWSPDNGGTPERMGTYAWISGLRVDPGQAGGARVFRPWGWPRALIVTEPVMRALSSVGGTGMHFEWAEGESLTADPHEAERFATLFSTTQDAREAFVRGLGEAGEMDDTLSHSPYWPNMRQLMRLRRPGGRTLLVTLGLTTTYYHETVRSTGLGVELALEVEAPLVEDEGFHELKSWPERLVMGVADAVAICGLHQDVDAFMAQEPQLPPEVCTPEGEVGVLVGRPTPTLPANFTLPAGEARLGTVTVLMPPELAWLRAEKGTAAELSARLAAAGVDTVYRGPRPSVV
ncbi:imm11 family protein [Corallococcus sp. M7]